jgi:uncharacterized protein YjiS (DUF1127 family)
MSEFLHAAVDAKKAAAALQRLHGGLAAIAIVPRPREGHIPPAPRIRRRRSPKAPDIMSVLDTNRSVPLGAIATFRTVSFLDRALNAATAWQRARGTRAALRSLSDDQLADIGLHRGEIPDIANALARR